MLKSMETPFQMKNEATGRHCIVSPGALHWSVRSRTDQCSAAVPGWHRTLDVHGRLTVDPRQLTCIRYSDSLETIAADEAQLIDRIVASMARVNRIVFDKHRHAMNRQPRVEPRSIDEVPP
jgi:hypothetical protein